ncbi:MAG: hypothetical protein IPI91_03980 [Flavobacteriales bacterium]|nr:hypothetical protein [Flavobacteriales bacterium]
MIIAQQVLKQAAIAEETVVKEVTCFTDGVIPWLMTGEISINNYSSTMVLTG